MARALAQQLEEANAEVEALTEQLANTQALTQQVQRAGEAAVIAGERALTQLMTELTERRSSGSVAAASEVSATERQRASAEIGHLRIDVAHYTRRCEELKAEAEQRAAAREEVETELTAAEARLAQERKQIRHYEACQRLGADIECGWAGIGPLGVGPSTLELRKEQQMKEQAAINGTRLAAEVTRLVGGASAQRETIDELGRQLRATQIALKAKDRQIESAQLQASYLESRLRARMAGLPAEGSSLAALEDSEGGGKPRGKKPPTSLKSHALTNSSTGRLPRLSLV